MCGKDGAETFGVVYPECNCHCIRKRREEKSGTVVSLERVDI
jgi:hypothetical protein